MATTSAPQQQTPYAPPTAAGQPSGRIASMDVVRGIVMVLMAIDHVRVYAGVPAGGPTAGVFFTRWITHFCAPAFVFLAGTAAFLYGRKLGDQRQLSRYLVTRGLLLVALELTLIHMSWTFTANFSNLLAGVIWVIGWSMIVLAGLVRFPPRAVGTFGVAVMALQSLLHLAARALPGAGPLWNLLYLGGDVQVGPVTLSVLYTLVPWVGVMAAGYGFGAVMLRPPVERRRACLRIGLGAVAAFVVLAMALAAARGPGDEGRPLLFRILDQNKYRDSQLFLLMTLGPAIAALPFLESARGRVARAFQTFGRVPMFYYLLHIPLIHAVSLIAWQLRDGAARPERFNAAPFVWMPEGERWSLALLYLVFAIVIALLYPACRWYASVKARNPRSWMRYL